MGEYNWKDFFKQSDRFIREWSESSEKCALNSVYLQASREKNRFCMAIATKNFMSICLSLSWVTPRNVLL